MLEDSCRIQLIIITFLATIFPRLVVVQAAMVQLCASRVLPKLVSPLSNGNVKKTEKAKQQSVRVL